MHFVQSRIATLDSFVVLFIVAMYYFMYRYTQTNFFKDGITKTLVPLSLSGLFMGFAVATKWSGGFGAVGLAIIFFVTIAKRYLEHKADSEINSGFYKSAGITLACCVGFFIAVPAVIYVLSYIPFYATGSTEMGFFAAIIQNQMDMVDFHLNLDATHRFSSNWWEWLINWRPMLLFDYLPAEGMTQNISTFGNPIVWWGGIPALIYTFYKAIRKDFTAIFLMLGYLSLFVPWLFASRLGFIYYYYPNVVFLVLMIAYSIKNISRKASASVFAVITFVLFLMFYPVISGVPISIAYVEMFLRWPFMREWILAFY
jgi:dolichyl-phosphate-mannose--protein O-mannosyl transferase